jgi:hypothetical protein
MPGLRPMQENGDVVLRFLAEDVAKRSGCDPTRFVGD